LTQKCIDQGGLPMVNVSYDGEVSNIWSSHFVYGILKRGPSRVSSMAAQPSVYLSEPEE
jgi:hypothetical protein